MAQMYLFLCVIQFLGMTAASTIGYHLANWKNKKGIATDSSTAATGAIFGLLGLLIAFTFSGAFTRFDDRRQIIVEEANSISTAYARLDLLPLATQGPLREQFKLYSRLRADLYPLLIDPDAARANVAEAERVQKVIWQLAVEATEGEGANARMLLLPAINQMIDITLVRTVAVQTHPPALIYAALAMVAFCCAGLVGYGAQRRHQLSYFHVVGFAGFVSFIFYVIQGSL